MARIRTIKPEFWSHPVTGRLDDASKSMAIALLNLADDEGYFYADAASVRSFARPFDDDSKTTLGCLQRLMEIEWIEVRRHSSHGDIGRVVNFTEHQRVDKPKTSSIKAYFIQDESKTIPRSIQDQSLQEGKGKEGKGGEGKGTDAGALPPLALAQKVASELCLTGRGWIEAIAGAIEFCAKFEKQTPNQAVDFLIAKAKEGIAQGRAPTTFWFQERKWQKPDDTKNPGRGYTPPPKQRSDDDD
jgi:hypothetical protein